MNKRMLVSLDQNHKHTFFAINNSYGIQSKALERSISTAPTSLFLSNDCFRFAINLIKT